MRPNIQKVRRKKTEELENRKRLLLVKKRQMEAKKQRQERKQERRQERKAVEEKQVKVEQVKVEQVKVEQVKVDEKQVKVEQVDEKKVKVEKVDEKQVKVEQVAEKQVKVDEKKVKVQPKKSSKNSTMISIAELKTICRERGIKGYSKKTKSQIISLLRDNYKDDKEIEEIILLVKNVKELKKLCYEMGIRGYSKKKKRELVDIVWKTKNYEKQIEKKLDQLLLNSKLPFYFASKNIILSCFYKIHLKNKEISLEECYQYINKKYDPITKDIVKYLCKKINKVHTTT